MATVSNVDTGYPKYFVLGDGRPGRRLTPDSLYQVLRDGKWVNSGDSYEFVHDAQPVTEGEFQEAVRTYNPKPKPLP